MDPDPQSNGRTPEDFREFLCHLASARLDPRLRSKLDPEDIVHDTLLEARAAIDKFPPHCETQQKAWLRRILLNNLLNALRDLRRHKRDVNREQSLDVAVEQSSLRLENLLAVEDSTPSKKAQQNELGLKLDEALATLAENHKQVVLLRYYHGWSVKAISRHLATTPTATAGLLHRALKHLRDQLAKAE